RIVEGHFMMSKEASRLRREASLHSITYPVISTSLAPSSPLPQCCPHLGRPELAPPAPSDRRPDSAKPSPSERQIILRRGSHLVHAGVLPTAAGRGHGPLAGGAAAAGAAGTAAT